MRRVWARAFAVAIPTRSPVNKPGPMSTAMAPKSSNSTRAWRRTKSMAGASVSACRWPRAEWKDARTPSWPPMAHPTCGVALSIPRISMLALSFPLLTLYQPPVEGAAQGVVARRPSRPRGAETHHACVVVVAELEPHLDELGRERRDHGVAPLDQRHALVVDQLAEAEVEELLQALEAVGVDVNDRKDALIRVHDHERGAGDGLLDAQGLAEPLHEGGLACAQVTGEQEQVAAPRHGGEFGCQGPRVVGRLGVSGQHGRPPVMVPPSAALFRPEEPPPSSARRRLLTRPAPSWRGPDRRASWRSPRRHRLGGQPTGETWGRAWRRRRRRSGHASW